MTYLNSPGRVTIDDVILNHDDGAVTWVFDKIDGWHNGPGIALEQQQRATTHGEFPQRGRRTGRTITVSGWLEGAERAAVAAAVRKLTALLADGRFGTFTFEDDDEGELTATVQLAGPMQLEWAKKTQADFQLQLLAPDPYRYGETSSGSTGFAAAAAGGGMVFPLFPGGVMDFGPLGDPGVVTISNPGTATATVKFIVAGPAPANGFSITDTTTGKKITYLGDLPDGSELVLDGADGSVVIDGVADRTGDAIVEAWPTIPPGQMRDFLFEPLSGSSAAVLTAEATATYW